MNSVLRCAAAVSFVALLACPEAQVVYSQQALSEAEVQLLVKQLSSTDEQAREDAIQELVEGAPTAQWDECAAFLELLPKWTIDMDPELSERLNRVRDLVEQRWARGSMQASKLSLVTSGSNLQEVIQSVKEQTGNQLVDYRERFNEPTEMEPWNFAISDRSYWQTLDKFLDATGLDLYSSSGEEGVGILNRGKRLVDRATRATEYVGPFRLEVMSLTSRRSFREAGENLTNIEVELAWEPRLLPLSFSLTPDDVKVLADNGVPLPIDRRNQVLGAEALPGNYATELTIPLLLPPRILKEIESLSGTLQCLIAGRKAEFRFPRLGKADNFEQFQGGVKVVLVTAMRNQDLWEVHMRLEVSDSVGALSLQRGWAFQNVAFMEDPQGNAIENVGFETTLQTEKTLGLAYLFDIPAESLDDYTWVYRSPAAIFQWPMEFELKNIPLP